MGSKISKPTRKLGDTISKNANPKINRSSDVNQLPSQFLKEKYEQNAIQKELKSNKDYRTPDESLNQGGDMHILGSSTKFDPKYLNKKLKNSSKAPSQEENPTFQGPEGKDGFDPQVGANNQAFINSVSNLGKSIHSSDANTGINPNFASLKQLRNRKALYERGQKELEHQMDPYGPASSSTMNEQNEVIRTMIHPRTLGAILNDLKDPRMTPERITQDYQLHSTFIRDLGTRFKVATTTKVIEEKTKDDEIAPKVVPVDKAMMDYGKNGDAAETVDKKRLKTLQSRLGMDEE